MVITHCQLLPHFGIGGAVRSDGVRKLGTFTGKAIMPGKQQTLRRGALSIAQII
jgi:hypothetical protein